MSLILDDNFSTYGTGALVPFGPWNGPGAGGSGSAGILAGSPSYYPGTFPSNNYAPADGKSPPTTKCVGLGLMDAYFGPCIGGVMCWSLNVIPFNASTSYLMRSSNATTTIPSPPGAIFTILLEADGSITLNTVAGTMLSSAGGPSNSMIQTENYLQFSAWNFVQLNFAISKIGHITGDTVGVGLSLTINDNFFVDGHADTGVLVTSLAVLAAGAPCVTTIGFASGLISGCLVTNVTVDANPIAGYPYPATPPLPLGRISQAVIEHLNLPNNANARASQAVIEWLKLPPENARVSQIVIEVMKGSGGPPPPPPPGALGPLMIELGAGVFTSTGPFMV